MNYILLTAQQTVTQAANAAQEVAPQSPSNDIIGIGGIIATLLVGIVTCLVTWKLTMKSIKQLKISYNIQVTVVEQQQIFIEPKGQHLIDNDIWKEHFLLQLEDDSKCIAYPDYDNYSVKGLPFYTHNVKKQRFKEYFEKLYKHN